MQHPLLDEVLLVPARDACIAKWAHCDAQPLCGSVTLVALTLVSRGRERLRGLRRPETPAVLDYKVMEGSMYNTPPCWSIYVCGLVFKHMLGMVCPLASVRQMTISGYSTLSACAFLLLGSVVLKHMTGMVRIPDASSINCPAGKYGCVAWSSSSAWA